MTSSRACSSTFGGGELVLVWLNPGARDWVSEVAAQNGGEAVKAKLARLLPLRVRFTLKNRRDLSSLPAPSR